MNRALLSFGVGVLFAVGLGISGMTDANVVLAFLDVGGDWDPSLILVMVGAIGVHLALFAWIVRRPSPIYADFHLPTPRDIDLRLIGGATIFGIGWGLGGYCPGPAVAGVASLAPGALVFTASMIVGMLIFRTIQARVGSSSVLAEDGSPL